MAGNRQWSNQRLQSLASRSIRKACDLSQRPHALRATQIVDRARDVVVVQQQLRQRAGRDAELLRGGSDFELIADEQIEQLADRGPVLTGLARLCTERR